MSLPARVNDSHLLNTKDPRDSQRRQRLFRLVKEFTFAIATCFKFDSRVEHHSLMSTGYLITLKNILLPNKTKSYIKDALIMVR